MTSVLLFQAFNGIVWGAIIALLAAGLNLVYGLLGIVNASQGAFYMLGAVACWWIADASGSYLLGVFGACGVGMLLGVLSERVILRKLETNHDLTIILTIGIMMVIEESAQWWFGADVRNIRGFLRGDTVSIFGISYPTIRLFVAGIAIFVLAGLWGFLHFTRFGLWMRAVRHDAETAKALGVPTDKVFMLTFGAGTALAALGGALVAQIVSIRVDMGFDILVTLFAVIIVGGLGNFTGALVVAISVTVLEGMASSFVTPAQARIISLVVLCAVLAFRPDGIFARRNVRVA